jgi:hypothetical protein
MNLTDEIIALLDREGASPFEVGIILTEVAHRRAFTDARVVSLEGLRSGDLWPKTVEEKQRAKERAAHKRRRRQMESRRVRQ